MNRRFRILVMMATLLVPAKALAHARLKRSQPAAGSQLTSPPQFVRLWFSEQPELSMTFASLSDSRGASFALSPAARETADQLGIAFHVLNVLPPGRYTLSWRTTASDGHPSSGKFTFVVLRGTTQVSGLAPQAASPRDSTSSAFSPETIAPAGKTADLDAGELDAASSVGNSIARALLFVGLLALVGAISFKLLILRGTRTVRVELKERMSQRAASLGTIAAAVVILVALLRLYLESQMMSAMPDMPGMRAMGARDMVMVTDWGFALRIQIAAAIAALIGFALAMRRIRGGWFVATAAALILAITPALSGHAAASPTFTSLMIAADWLHVLGGASWLGSLLCLMVIGVPVALTLDPLERWPSIASLVNAFSPVALVSAGVVVASGAFASWIHLQHLSALWQTTYGKTLLVKLLLVAITFAIGAYNFKRVQPRLLTEIGVSRLEKSAATELVVGFMILLVTGLLTGVSP